MAKKRKRYVRPHYTAKALRIKQAPKKPVPKELKFGIAFCAVALVVAVVVFFAIYRDGSLDIVDGMPVIPEGENWIVANVGTQSDPKYFKLGQVQPLEGYALDEAQSASASETGFITYAFVPEDSDSRILSYIVRGLNDAYDANAASANRDYLAWNGNLTIGSIQHMHVGDTDVDYFTTATPVAPEQETQQQMISYLPAGRSRTVTITVFVRTSEALDPLPDEALEALTEQIIGTITLDGA